MKSVVRVIIVLIGANVICGIPFAAPLVITVDDDLTELPTADYTEIQDAIDYVVANGDDGDIIRVYPGLYRECLEINPAMASPVVSFVLESSNPRDPATVATTIIDADTDNDGNGDGIAIQFEGGETTDAAVRGFTIRNGYSVSWDGGGISGRRQSSGCSSPNYCGTDAQIEYNVITDCEAVNGGGIAWCNGIIQFNEITENHASVSGGGIGNCGEQGTSAPAVDYTRTTIFGNLLSENTSDSHGGGMFHTYAAISQNKIVNNDADGVGGGMYWVGPATVERNIIANNHADGSGGGMNNVSEAVSIANNLIVNNTSGGNGGGAAECLLSHFRHNVFYGNDATGAAGGLFIASALDTYIYNNIFWANTGDTTSPYTNANFYYYGETGSNTLYNAIQGYGGTLPAPQFIDVDGPDNTLSTYEDNDFRLENGADLIDVGYNIPSSFSDLVEDFAGNPRPQDSGYDVGAYENPALPGAHPACWFHETFDDVYNHHWTRLGNPMLTGTEASGNKYVYGDTNSVGIFHAIEGDEYDVQFRYKALDITGSGSYGGMVLRYRGLYDSVTVLFYETYARLLIYKFNSSTNSSQLVTNVSNSSFTTTEDVWYSVRAHCEGANIVVERAVPGGDWETVFNVTTSPITTSGGIVLKSHSGSFAFDDVCIDLADPPALASDESLPACVDAYVCEDAEDEDVSEWFLSTALSVEEEDGNHFVEQITSNAARHVVSDNDVDIRFSFFPLSNATAFPTLQVIFKSLGDAGFYRIGMYPHYADVYNYIGGSYQPHNYRFETTWNAGYWYDVWIRSDLGQHTMWMRRQGYEWEEVFDFYDTNLDATGQVVITTSTDPVVRWDNLVISPLYTNSGGSGWPTCTASLLCDDFNDGDYSGWTGSGSWSVDDSEESSYYAEGVSATGTAPQLTHPVTSTDVTIGFSYKLIGPWTSKPTSPGTSFTVNFRYLDGSNFNKLQFNPMDAKLLTRAGGVGQPTLVNNAGGSVPGRWYDVEIVCNGANVTINRREQGREWEELLTSTSAAMSANAQIQFIPVGGATVRIDDVSIDN